jgi:hypothetical protein
LSRARSGRALLAAAALAVAAAVAQPVPAGAARWTRPLALSAPGSLSLSAPRIALSPSGAVLVGWSESDPDYPPDAGVLFDIGAAGAPAADPHRVGVDRSLLAAAPFGDGFLLLDGVGVPGRRCCSSVRAVRLGATGSVLAAQTLVGGLTGPASGRLVQLPGGGMLAAIATAGGVWVDSAGADGRFTGKQRLTGAGARPAAIDAARLKRGSAVGWTDAAQGAGADPFRSVFEARGAGSSLPRGRRAVVTAAAGHRIDELSLAPGGALAWIESYTDVLGAYHSVAMAGRAKLSGAAVDATALTLAVGPRGEELAAFLECDPAGEACATRVAAAPAGGAFAPAARLGAADPGIGPQLAVAPTGTALACWTAGGRVACARGSAATGRFGAPAMISHGTASGLAVAFAAGGDALAVWAQGTTSARIVAARYR